MKAVSPALPSQQLLLVSLIWRSIFLLLDTKKDQAVLTFVMLISEQPRSKGSFLPVPLSLFRAEKRNEHE